MTEGISRRNFLKGAAAGTMGVAALGALAGCSPAGAPEAGAAAEAPMAETGSSYDVMAQMTDLNRNMTEGAVAATSPEDFIVKAGDGALKFAPGGDPLGITPADFMNNVPAWLGEVPTRERGRDEGLRCARHRRRQCRLGGCAARSGDGRERHPRRVPDLR